MVLGLPWALVTHVGWPLPDRLPALHDLTTALAAPFSGRTLLNVLACLCWITWAWFVVDLVRCAVAVLRGRDAHASGLIARIAGMLVAAIAIAGSRSAYAHAAQQATSVAGSTTADTTTSIVVTETVQPPHNGVSDSLWRVAERIWGDGTRWPELFDQNRGVVQPDGQALTIPDHIRPGWRITATIPTPTPEPHNEPAPTTPEPSTPTTAPRSAEPPSEPAKPGLELPTGTFVSVALAAAVATTVAIVRMRHRRRYRVGSRDRSDLKRPPGPVVRALLVPAAAAEANQPTTGNALPIGVHDGRERAVDLVSVGGIGLTGPGHAAATRAILLHLLATPDTHQVFIPRPDVDTLFANQPRLPANIVITDSTAAALDKMETIVTRGTDPGEGNRIAFLGAPGSCTERLADLLKSSADLGAIVLGPWHPGATLHVGRDGIVTAPGWDGTRLFSMPDADAAELLELLHSEDVDEPPTNTNEQPEPPRAPARSVHLRIVGRMHLEIAGEDRVHAVAPKQRELLVYLALRPDGARRAAIIADIWPDAPGHRPGNSFHATLSQLRQAIRKASGGTVDNITVTHDGHYALDRNRVHVDLWALRDALDASDDPDPDRLVHLYRGELGEGIDAEWLIVHREELRRDVLDTLEDVRGNNIANPEHQLKILEQMRRIDPYNEGIYRDIMRLQSQLGRAEAMSRTVALLEANLGDIGEKPTSETLDIARMG